MAQLVLLLQAQAMLGEHGALLTTLLSHQNWVTRALANREQCYRSKI